MVITVTTRCIWWHRNAFLVIGFTCYFPHKEPVMRVLYNHLEPFAQAHIKENSKAPRHRPMDSLHKGSSNAENVSIWWRHHVIKEPGWRSIKHCSFVSPHFCCVILPLRYFEEYSFTYGRYKPCWDLSNMDVICNGSTTLRCWKSPQNIKNINERRQALLVLNYLSTLSCNRPSETHLKIGGP